MTLISKVQNTRVLSTNTRQNTRVKPEYGVEYEGASRSDRDSCVEFRKRNNLGLPEFLLPFERAKDILEKLSRNPLAEGQKNLIRAGIEPATFSVNMNCSL
jgi:hypothetical protein